METEFIKTVRDCHALITAAALSDHYRTLSRHEFEALLDMVLDEDEARDVVTALIAHIQGLHLVLARERRISVIDMYRGYLVRVETRLSSDG